MKRITTILAFLAFVFSSSLISAQNYESLKKTSVHAQTHWYKLMTADSPNYYEVIHAFEDYFKTNPHVKSVEELEYKRWLKRIGSNFDAQGKIYEVKNDISEANTLLKNKQKSRTKSNWTVIGPTEIDWEAPMGSSHTTQGVIRSVTQHPTNTDKVLVGSISAGIWLSTDNGDSWQNVGTDLLFDNVNGIAFAKSNPEIVYAASNSGPLKSTDGGLAWSYTGLNESGNYPGGPTPYGMIVDDANPDIAFYASSWGLWKTTDGGATWVKELADHVWDIEYHPTNSQIIYASVDKGYNTDFMKSTDGGENWVSITSGYSQVNVKRMCIAVTPAAPNNVYIYAADANQDKGIIYKSENEGGDFTKIESPNMMPYEQSGTASGLGQATWDMALAVSTTDADFILAGGIFVWKSLDGGGSWSVVDPGHPQSSAHWYHWDCQGLSIYDNKAWLVNDGGVFLSTDKLVTTSNKSLGISAQEIWGFDTGWKSDIMALGLYHGPVQIRDDEIYQGWYIAPGADAGTVQINKGDDNYIYAHPWGDVKITRSDSRMTAPVVSNLGAKLPFYIYPIEIADHNYYNTFYTIDEKEVKKTLDNAKKWESKKKFGSTLRRITTSYSNSDVVYVMQGYNRIWNTLDGGNTWEELSIPSSLTQYKSLSNFTIDGEDENVIWVSMGGKQNNVKVLKTVDGGQNWIDYSDGLPSYAINSIVNQIGTDGGVYAATDAGVYYRNNTMDEWVLHSTGLPTATRVYFVRLNYAKEKIRIGTLRGIWEGDFYESSDLVVSPISENKGLELGGTNQFFDHSTSLKDATYVWTFEGGTPETTTDENPLVTYNTQGTFDVTLAVTDARGTVEKTFTDFIVVGDDEAPTQPLNFMATDITGTSLTLSWDHSTDNVAVTGYKLYLNDMYLKSINATTFDLSGLQSGNTYELYIVAHDAQDNESLASETLTVEMPAGGDNDPIAQTKWTLHAVNSEETQGEDGKAVNAFDGDESTIWHTEWSVNTPTHPHHIDINLNETYVITEFSYTPRQNGVNGRIKNYEIYVSTDGVNWGNAIASGVWVDSEATQKISINKKVARYIRLKALSEVNDGAWASVAEINLRGGVYSSLVETSSISNELTCKMYPNPATSNFSIDVDNANGKVQVNIYSVTGVLVKNYDMGTDKKMVISDLNAPAGIYVVEIEDAKQAIYKKLILD